MLSSYTPFSSGPPHPTKLCTSAIMETARPTPPTADECGRALHPTIANNDKISAAQRDAVVLARMKNEQGHAFLIADATGCGKGREGVAVALNNMAKDAVDVCFYFSTAQLFTDLKRDVRDLGCKLPVIDIRDTKTLPKKGIVFVPYSIASKKQKNAPTVLERIVKAHKGTPVSLVLDECHIIRKSEGAGASQTGQRFSEFLDAMAPDARILFMSATFCASLTDMPIYAKHLGLVGPKRDFETFTELQGALDTRASAGALELLNLSLIHI